MFLAVPIAVLILDGNFSGVLWIAVVAGVSDWLDGFLARRMDALSRYGAVVDPLSDKVMLACAFVSLSVVGLVPWWLAFIVVLRDMLIVSGALAYHWLYGRYEIDPSIWGKLSTFVQISVALFIISHQVLPILPDIAQQVGWWLVVLMSLISGGHYAYVWTSKALSQ